MLCYKNASIQLNLMPWMRENKLAPKKPVTARLVLNESVFLVFNRSLASLVNCAIIWQRVTIAGIKSVSIDPMKNKIKL